MLQDSRWRFWSCQIWLQEHFFFGKPEVGLLHQVCVLRCFLRLWSVRRVQLSPSFQRRVAWEDTWGADISIIRISLLLLNHAWGFSGQRETLCFQLRSRERTVWVLLRFLDRLRSFSCLTKVLEAAWIACFRSQFRLGRFCWEHPLFILWILSSDRKWVWLFSMQRAFLIICRFCTSFCYLIFQWKHLLEEFLLIRLAVVFFVIGVGWMYHDTFRKDCRGQF